MRSFHRVNLLALVVIVWLGFPIDTLALCPQVPGDVDGDLKTSVTDVQCGILSVLWSLAGEIGAVPGCIAGSPPVVDINCDSAIVVTDVQLLITYALGAPLSLGIDANGNGCADTCEPSCAVDPSVCDDGNPCTSDVCDASAVCVHANVLDGTLCNADGDGCTHNDHCAAGVCVVGALPACNDGLTCTADTCLALGAGGYTCKFTVNPSTCFTSTTIDGKNFVASAGCGPYFSTTAPGGLQCTGGGCANVCGTNNHLDYAVSTVPGESYQVVVKVADYRHNCKETLKMAVVVGGVSIGTFTGSGTNTWAFPQFSFVAGANTTTLAVTQTNDAYCIGNKTCSPTCAPLYGDLNMFIDYVQVVSTTGGGPCLSCDDGVPCTLDVCTDGTGCTNVPVDGAGTQSTGQPGAPGTVLLDVVTVPSGAPLNVMQQNAMLTCEPAETILAPDGSPITPVVEWLVNGEMVLSGPGLDIPFGTLSAKSGDTISCRLRTCDGSGGTLWAEAENPTNVADSPPVVEPIVQPVYLNEDFTCEVSATDPDGDWFSLSVVWEVTSAPEDGSITTQIDTTSTTLPAAYVADLFGRKATVVCLGVASDGKNNVVSTSAPVAIKNHPPTLSGITMTPDNGGPYSKTKFTCTPGQVTDLDGDSVTIEIAFLENDSVWQQVDVLPGGSSVSFKSWVKGAVVTCEAIPRDVFDIGPSVTQSVTIVNHAPVCQTATVSPPGAPYPTGVNLTCGCSSVLDYDGDASGTSCTWTTWAGETLPWTGCSRNTTDIPSGWSVFCNVAPKDGAGPGVSAPVLITRTGNNPPTWDIPAVGGVTLSPTETITAADIDTVFACNYPATAVDPDGSGVSYVFEWAYRRGLVTYPLNTSAFNTPTVTLKALAAAALGGSSLPKKADEIYCRVRAKDGQSGSDIAKDSQTVVIADHPAKFDSAQFPNYGGKASHDGIVYPGETYVCEGALIDFDNDSLLEIKIMTWNPGDLTSAYVLVATTGWITQDYGKTSVVIDPSKQPLKSRVSCRGGFKPMPDQTGPAYTGPIFFPWSFVADEIPTVTADLVPQNSTPCEFRTCVVDISDVDALLEFPLTGLTVTIRWEVDGVPVLSTTEPLDTINPDGLTLVVPADGLSVHDGAEIQCFAKVNKGPWITSLEAASPVGIVTGNAPVVETVGISGPIVAGEMVTCLPGAVINNCDAPTKISYRWLVNGTVVPGATGQKFSTFGFGEGAQVTCEAKVTGIDGPASGPWTGSPPTVLGKSLWTLIGPPDGGFAGASVAVMTDVNGDERDEVVIGAPQATHDGQTIAGRVFVAFGQEPGSVLQLGDLLGGIGGIVLGGETGSWPPYQTICKEPTTLVNFPCKPGVAGISTDGANQSPQGDAAGTRVRALGDITGDGIDDLLVSAPYAFALGKYLSGRTYIISGADIATLVNSPPQSISYAAWLRIDGEAGLFPNKAYTNDPSSDWKLVNGHLAGFGLAAGDFTGDGVPDVGIGAPNVDTYEADNGRVYMLDGLALAKLAPEKLLTEPADPTDSDDLSVWLGTLFAQDPDPMAPPLVGRVFDGPKNFGDPFRAQVGALLNSRGDMNGDGRDELLAGPWGLYPNSFALTWNPSPTADGVATDLQTATAPMVVKNDPGYFAFTMKPGQVLSEIVTSGRLTTWARAAIGGDINGDGLADLVAPAYENEGGKKQLEIAVLFGAPGLTKYDHNTADNGTGGFVIEGNTKEGKSDGFIDGLPAGDIDGDGLDEVAFIVRPIGTGAPKARLYVAWGKANGTTVLLSDVEKGGAGFTLDFPIDIWSTTTGDVNGDGLGDLVVGIGGDFTKPPQNGFVEVHYGRDFRGLLTHRGDEGDNVLVGSADIDRMIGGRGDDTLVGSGGADVLYAGPGNDRIEISDGTFTRVDGASGTDTLALAPGVDLDLTQTGLRVREFEAIELGGGQTLTLSDGFAGRQSQSSATLAVIGSGTLNSAPATLDSALWGNWTNEGESTWPEEDPTGVPVTVYRSGPTRLLVEQGINTLLPPSFVNLVFEIGELQPNGAVVGYLDAVDADGTIMGLDLVNGDPFGIFAFDPFTGALVLANATPVDYELRKFWTLTVEATDDNGLVRTGEIVVRILDENEPPVFAKTNVMGTVVEGAANGTIVAQVVANDPDEGDVVTYSMTPHEIFSLDPVSGLIAVIDGGSLDFESGDGYPMTILATDSLGLTVQTDVFVTVTDVPNIEQTIDLWFVTEKQSLSGPEEAYGFTVPPITHTIDFGDSFLSHMAGGFQNLAAGFAVSGSVSGKIKTTYGGEFGTGDVNAVLPVSVKIEFPDELTLGEPFVLTSSWTLGDLAQFWGKTTHVNLFMNQSYSNITMKLQQFGEMIVDIGPWSFDSSLSGKPFVYKIPAKTFQSVRFKKAFPDGITIPQDLLDLAELNESTDFVKPAFDPIPDVSVYDDFWQATTVAEINDAQELYDLFGATGAFQDDELMVTPEVKSSLYDGYISLNDIVTDWLGLGVGTLKGNPTSASFEVPVAPLGYVSFLIELYRNWLTVKLKMRETFFLDIKDVTATATFEDGTKVPFVVGEDIEITLPETADINADGKVEVAFEFGIDTLFTHWKVFRVSLLDTSRIGFLSSKSYKYIYSSTGAVIGKDLVAQKEQGPLYESTWIYGFEDKPQDVEQWSLQGFNTPKAKGTVDLAQ
ncbi:MAG: FG-GAP repeat protein [Myxococcales bacterium]|nr:FG-GAP repeat protein [Myxococcales bacterium]